MALPNADTQREFYQDVPIKRLIAWVFDSLIIVTLSIFAALLTLGIAFFFFFALWAAIAFLYRWITISARSATPGMRLMGIELRTAQGQKLDGVFALMHTLGTMFCFGTLLQFVSIILMCVSKQGQGLVDMVLGTSMLNKTARY